MPGPDGGLALDGVTAGYGERTVLNGLSLLVRPGEVVGVVGPNGSGKTTLVRVASRALRPWSGSVRVGNEDPYSMPSRRAARLVAVVPQETSPSFPFSVLEVVLMGRAPYLSPWGAGKPEDWSRTRAAMEAALVGDLADRPFDELSGGEKQRVVLAQALAQNAPVLLLDEPTTHLDIRNVVEILGVVRGIARREGHAVLGVFHDLNLASAYCDRLYAIGAGSIVAEGSPSEVVTTRLLSDLYGVDAEVHQHERTGRPIVTLSPAPDIPFG